MPIAAPAQPLMGIATSVPHRNPMHTPNVGLRCANPTYQRPILRMSLGMFFGGNLLKSRRSWLFVSPLHRVILGRVRRVLRTIVSARPVPRRNPTQRRMSG